MKPIVCVSCEGSESKFVVLSKEKDEIKVLETVSVGMLKSTMAGGSDSEQLPDLGIDDLSTDITFESSGAGGAAGKIDKTDIGTIAADLSHIKLSQAQFIPILTEPILNYHVYEGERIKDRNKLLDAIVEDIAKSKNISVRKDFIDYTDFDKDSLLSVFIEGEVPCLNLIDSLAEYNGRRYYKVSTLKSAEVALAYYISKTTKFFPEDYSLIIYTGKDYSKLIFLEGQNLKHIGTTLDIGTENLHTYDVYFSKILLEMENGGIPRLDNVILCGSDKSENLILSFYGTFPEANVTELKFDGFNISGLTEEQTKNLSSYAIPLSAAVEYFDEVDKQHIGINILPKFIKEKQKFFQLSWHSLLVFPLLAAAAYFFTISILEKHQEIESMDKEILRLTQLQEQNRAIANEMALIQGKINQFDNTQAILDSASAGTEIWSEAFDNISNFIERRRNFWITKLESTTGEEVKISGYSLSRSSLTEFADYNNASILQNILYEPLRERNAFSYSLNFKLSKETVEANGP